MPNVYAILGNHEHLFLKYYHSLLDNPTETGASVLEKLRAYFSDGDLLDWDTVDYLDSLPAYIEKEDFICVHAGIPLDESNMLRPLASASVNQLVNDRHFKEPSVRHESEKCVFFGHTQTDCVSGEYKILGYPKNKSEKPTKITDFYKIHLDTGACNGGALSCFAIDSLRAYYVKKEQ